MPGSIQQRTAGAPLLPQPVKTKRKLKVLGFDGAKVHDFLFHVALAEVQWRDLATGSSTQLGSLVQNHQARDRASWLYELFLQACNEGPGRAKTFLAQQHKLQKMYLQKSQALLQSSAVQMANDQTVLSEVAFGAQTVKSAATVGVAIIGLLLVGPEAIAGAGIALAFDISMEMISRLGEPSADAVIVGFKQTMANDVVGVAGSVQQARLATTKQVMQQTLAYPMKSSTYRATSAMASQLNGLMTTLGIISAGVTLYTEGSATLASYEQMKKAQAYSASLRSQSH